MKKIIILIVVVIAIAIGVIGNVKDTTVICGVLAENNNKVDIKITKTNLDKIFNKMSEDMIVVGEDVNYRYIFSGYVFDIEKYYAAPIHRMGDTGLATQGYLLFDKEMKNIVIETSQEVVIACTKDFFNMVTK